MKHFNLTIHISPTERVHSIAHKVYQILPMNEHDDFRADLRYTSGRAEALGVVEKWVNVAITKKEAAKGAAAAVSTEAKK